MAKSPSALSRVQRLIYHSGFRHLFESTQRGAGYTSSSEDASKKCMTRVDGGAHEMPKLRDAAIKDPDSGLRIDQLANAPGPDSLALLHFALHLQLMKTVNVVFIKVQNAVAEW